MSKRIIEYGNSMPTDFDSMEPEHVYWDDASDYGIMRTSTYGLYIVRKERLFMTCPDEFSDITKHINFDYVCKTEISGKLYIGFSKGKCCYPQDSIKNVAYYMKEAGIEEFQVKQFNSMMDAMKFIGENNLETIVG